MKLEAFYEEAAGVVKMKVTPEAHFDERESAEFMEHPESLFEGKPNRYLICDVSENPARSMSKEGRKWMSEHASRIGDASGIGHASGIGIEKIAIVGSSPVTRMIAKIMVTTLKKANSTQFFRTESEAFRWLKEEK